MTIYKGSSDATVAGGYLTFVKNPAGFSEQYLNVNYIKFLMCNQSNNMYLIKYQILPSDMMYPGYKILV